MNTLIYNLKATIFTLSIICIYSCSSKSSSTEEEQAKYISVQVEKDGSWSIMDADGKLVVKDEYGSDNELSPVYGNVYWVKYNDKYQLFSMDSPKKAISEEYDGVTDFSGGLAFASVMNKPIVIIGDDGKVKTTMSKDIVSVSPFKCGMARFKNKNGKYGYVDEGGKVVIEAKYIEAENFSEDLAVVKEKKESGYTIIDRSGKKVGETPAKKYSMIGEFSNGKAWTIAYFETDDGEEFYGYPAGNMVFIDKTGSEVLTVKGEFNACDGFKDGYCVAYSAFEGGALSDYALFDEKGEKVLRNGKYSYIKNLGGGMFEVVKNGKCGVVDKDDNTVVDFNYEQMYTYCNIDGRFIMYDGQYLLIDQQGKEVKGATFATVGNYMYNDVNYVDVDWLVKEVTGPITVNGYTPLKGKKTAASIAALYKLPNDEWGEEYDPNYSFINLHMYKQQGYWQTTLRVEFDNPVSYVPETVKKVSDGWFEHNEVTYGERTWNPNANLKEVVIVVSVYPFNSSTFFDAIGKGLTAKGFKQDGNLYKASNGASVELTTTEFDSDINISFKY